MSLVNIIKTELHNHITIDPERSKAFFKTGSGEYAERDVFIGVRVPDIRILAKKFSDLKLDELHVLIMSPINEERLLALIILTLQYKNARQETARNSIYQFYIDHIRQVNNWNLVDSSAHLIVGAHLFAQDEAFLIMLAHSDNVWERRIAIVATWYFIRKNEPARTFIIARMLLNDAHDLIHKATGWMLREAGKKDRQMLVSFLNDHATQMPRTMLRYAIDKFPEHERKRYLAVRK